MAQQLAKRECLEDAFDSLDRFERLCPPANLETAHRLHEARQLLANIRQLECTNRVQLASITSGKPMQVV